MAIATDVEEPHFVARIVQQKRRQMQDFCKELLPSQIFSQVSTKHNKKSVDLSTINGERR